MPQNVAVELPANTPLTDLEFELHGQTSIPFGCRLGVCGACVIEVVEGVGAFDSKGAGEADFLATLGYPGDAFRLACQCRLQAPATIRSVF